MITIVLEPAGGSKGKTVITITEKSAKKALEELGLVLDELYPESED